MQKSLACGLPSPGTACVRPLQRSHFVQVETSAAISLSISSEDIVFLPLSKDINVWQDDPHGRPYIFGKHLMICRGDPGGRPDHSSDCCIRHVGATLVVAALP